MQRDLDDPVALTPRESTIARDVLIELEARLGFLLAALLAFGWAAGLQGQLFSPMNDVGAGEAFRFSQNWALGGWQLSAIHNYRSGSPLQIGQGGIHGRSGGEFVRA